MKRLILSLLLSWPLVYGVAHAATTATVTPGVWNLYRGTSIASTHATEAACIQAAKDLAVTRYYTCRTITGVAVAVTVDPPPPPDPTPTPTGSVWTDLSSAPDCAKVTVYPERKVVTPAEAGILIHEGRCIEATPATFNEAFWRSVVPGDVVTLRAGTYTADFGEGTWYGNETYKKGTRTQPIALVAAPGEVVTFTSSSRAPFIFGDGSRNTNRAEYLTLGGINVVSHRSCISGGGATTDPAGGPDETGGLGIRVVGGSCTITDAVGNTMTGLISLQNDGWKILGVKFRDPPGRAIINNNHGVYIQGGADDVEVAYNDFQLRVGHVIQNHQDGAKKLYERLSIHDNVIRGVNYGDMRGIAVINVHDASTISVVRNKISHQGQDTDNNGSGWGCFNFYNGQITLTSNDCTDSQGGLNLNGQYTGQGKVVAHDNLICPLSGYARTKAENGQTLANLIETAPRVCP